MEASDDPESGRDVWGNGRVKAVATVKCVETMSECRRGCEVGHPVWKVGNVIVFPGFPEQGRETE